MDRSKPDPIQSFAFISLLLVGLLLGFFATKLFVRSFDEEFLRRVKVQVGDAPARTLEEKASAQRIVAGIVGGISLMFLLGSALLGARSARSLRLAIGGLFFFSGLLFAGVAVYMGYVLAHPDRLAKVNMTETTTIGIGPIESRSERDVTDPSEKKTIARVFLVVFSLGGLLLLVIGTGCFLVRPPKAAGKLSESGVFHP